jgi:2'-5' RNA ligase
MPRLFVALDPPAPVRDALAALRADVPGARWTPTHNVHLTLAFIGEVDGERVPAVEAALAGVANPPVPVEVTGLGAFPNRRAARVLSAVVALHPSLAALHAQVARALAVLGVEPERRPFPDGNHRFRPHLTLARLKEADRRSVQAFLEQPVPRLAFEAAAFHLFESTPGPGGSTYRRLGSYPLA